jgi:hypothetical protein
VDEPPTGKAVIHALTKTSVSDASQALVTVQVVSSYQVVHASYLNSLTIMTGLGYNISDDLCSLSGGNFARHRGWRVEGISASERFFGGSFRRHTIRGRPPPPVRRQRLEGPLEVHNFELEALIVHIQFSIQLIT